MVAVMSEMDSEMSQPVPDSYAAHLHPYPPSPSPAALLRLPSSSQCHSFDQHLDPSLSRRRASPPAAAAPLPPHILPAALAGAAVLAEQPPSATR